jgi:PPP family 3-phenylpropionic acid transporter
MAQPFYITYIVIYQSHIGMSKTMIGIVGACIALTMLVVKPVIGAITDKAKNKNRVVFWLLLISSITILFFYVGYFLPERSMALFILVAACMLCHQMFFGTAATLFEANGVEMLNERKGKWNSGHIRLGGTIGFMISALISSRIIAGNHFERMFIILSVFCIINAIWVSRLPAVPGKARKKERVPYSEIFKNRPFLVMLFLQFTNSIGMVFIRFFHIYLTDTSVNAFGRPNGLGFDGGFIGVRFFGTRAKSAPKSG